MNYLDHAATTPVCAECKKVMAECNAEFFYNPSALYRHAEELRRRIECARKTIADLLCCEPCEIYFTSGATESNNLAILSGAAKRQKLLAVTSEGEHASVFESFMELKRRGARIKLTGIDSAASADPDRFIEHAGAEDCGFASLIHASNETGAINDIAGIFKEVKRKNPSVLLHSDGVQAFCKIETDLKKLGADFYSVSGHKVGAAKGIGVLFIKKSVSVRPQSFGGGQEKGMRSGTENVAGILGFAAAAQSYADAYRATDFAVMKKRFFEIVFGAGQVNENGKSIYNLQSILSMSIIGIQSEVLQRVLADQDDIIIGTGSACASSKSGNRVLSAAGKTKPEIDGNVRIGFGTTTNIQSAELAAKRMLIRVHELRGVKA